jgi:hypothetical protein
LHVQRLTRLVLLSSSLLTIAAAAPAVADSTFTNGTTSVTLKNDGTIYFTCQGITHLASGKEAYVICVNNATSGAITLGTTFPAGGAVAFNQTITADVITTTLGGKLGVHTFLTWTGGTCTFDVTQKLFNKSGDIIKITQYKRVADVNVDGDSGDDTFVGGTLTVRAADIHTVTLSGGGNSGATNASAYSMSSFAAEIATCGMSAGATKNLVTESPTDNNRAMAVRYNFVPGYVGLKPAGQSGSEKFFSVRYTVQ